VETQRSGVSHHTFLVTGIISASRRMRVHDRASSVTTVSTPQSLIVRLFHEYQWHIRQRIATRQLSQLPEQNYLMLEPMLAEVPTHSIFVRHTPLSSE